MSDEIKNEAPDEQAPVVKKPSLPTPKRNPVNPFHKNNRFISPKSGNPGSKGSGAQKGGGMKKGK